MIFTSAQPILCMASLGVSSVAVSCCDSNNSFSRAPGSFRVKASAEAVILARISLAFPSKLAFEEVMFGRIIGGNLDIQNGVKAICRSLCAFKVLLFGRLCVTQKRMMQEDVRRLSHFSLRRLDKHRTRTFLTGPVPYLRRCASKESSRKK